MALADTNCDPDPIDYVIPCNDDALKSVKLIMNALMQAIIDKKNDMNLPVSKGDEGGPEDEDDEEETEESDE